MNPFTYSRATDAQQAISTVNGDAKIKFLGGGTNLIDLMKMGVEQPVQLVDINRLPLTQVEELPGGAGVRIGGLARNSDVAEHPLIAQRYSVLSQALLAGASPQLRNMANDRRESIAAHALLLFLRSRVRDVQQAQPRERLRCVEGI
jgi:xanthine dehydrogenase YagS FAD-binding subunit